MTVSAAGVTSATLVLRPRDPLIFRDARPFTAEPGARAMTLDWPLPQTVAGALRSHVGEAAGFDWRADGPDKARAIRVLGGFPVAEVGGARQVFLAAPRDAVPYEDEDGTRTLLCLRPDEAPDAAGCDTLPGLGLRPLTPADVVKETGRLAFWSLADLVRWLREPVWTHPPALGMPALPKETRVHVAVNAATGTAREGFLFSTSGLAFAEGPERPGRFRTALAPVQEGTPAPTALGMLVRVERAPADWQPRPGLVTFGGERRLTEIEPASDALWPTIPPGLGAVVASARRIRLQLATPAIFAGGWRPGWLRPDSRGDGPALVGRPPGWDGPALRLVGAAVGRRIPVSGWDMQARQGRGQPKPVRYAVPAGSVYFFESLDEPVGQAAADALWLRPVGDDEQDRRDGYGLALPGRW